MHVFGPPDKATLGPDESLCIDAKETLIVYHVLPVQGETEWICACCGSSTDELTPSLMN